MFIIEGENGFFRNFMKKTNKASAEPEKKPERTVKQKSPMNPIQVFLLNALIVVTVLWLLFGFVLGLAAAPNGDMAPNIKNADLLLFYRLNSSFQAQDVVVLRKNDTTYIGRVVAVGGDSVDITDEAALVINGNIVSESNIYTATPRYEGFQEYPVKVPEGSYFILADSRNGGEDSRYYGTVTGDEINGRVITVIRRNNL